MQDLMLYSLATGVAVNSIWDSKTGFDFYDTRLLVNQAHAAAAANYTGLSQILANAGFKPLTADAPRHYVLNHRIGGATESYYGGDNHYGMLFLVTDHTLYANSPIYLGAGKWMNVPAFCFGAGNTNSKRRCQDDTQPHKRRRR